MITMMSGRVTYGYSTGESDSTSFAATRSVTSFVRTVRQFERGLEVRSIRKVKGAKDRPLRPRAVAERLLFDDVLDVHVAEQRPLAGLADVDEPLLGGLVLLVGDVVLDDRLVDPPQDVGDQSVQPIPAAGLAHRLHEQVRRREIGEHLRTVVSSGERIGEIGAHEVEDADRLQDGDLLG